MREQCTKTLLKCGFALDSRASSSQSAGNSWQKIEMPGSSGLHDASINPILYLLLKIIISIVYYNHWLTHLYPNHMKNVRYRVAAVCANHGEFSHEA